MDQGTSEESAQLLALRTRIDALENQRAELDRELLRRAYRIGELETELREVEFNFAHSLSWRITKPVRALKTLLGRLISR